MKFLSTQYFGVITLLLVSLSLSAQDLPNIFIDDQQVEPAQTVELDVLVKNYNDIVTAAFSVNWDSMMLRYVGIDNIAFGLSEDDNFNAMNASGGELTYLYFDNSLSGNSLEDDGVLFTVQLEVIGMEGEQTEISFGGLMEVVDTSEVDLEAEFSGALISIGEPNSLQTVTLLPLSAEVSPNPFTNNGKVILGLSEGGEVHWTLSEINGQHIMDGKADFSPGSHVLELENTLFKHTGSYILQLQLGDLSITKRLLYVEP